MEPKSIDYMAMYEKAIIENEQMESKIEMQDELIERQETQIKNQQDIIHSIEKKNAEMASRYEDLMLEHNVLKAQMDVVWLIFGGVKRE